MTRRRRMTLRAPLVSGNRAARESSALRLTYAKSQLHRDTLFAVASDSAIFLAVLIANTRWQSLVMMLTIWKYSLLTEQSRMVKTAPIKLGADIHLLVLCNFYPATTIHRYQSIPITGEIWLSTETLHFHKRRLGIAEIVPNRNPC